MPGPSIGRERECLVHVAKDAASLMPALSWSAMGQGVETVDPRYGLTFGSQPVIGLESVGGRRVAVLHMLLAEVHGSDEYDLRVSVDLGTGRALGLMLSWKAYSKVLYVPCTFGVSRESPRSVDVTFSPRSGAPSQRTEGAQHWEDGHIRWSPLVDPDRFSSESVSIGPDPRVVVHASSAPPLLGSIDFNAPLVPLDQQGEEQIYSTDLSSYGDHAVWVESLVDRERIRTYTQAGGVKVDLDPAPGFVRRVAYDGQRLSGTTQARPPYFFDSSGDVGLWTRDPQSGVVTTSPVFVGKHLAAASKLKAADTWAVVDLESGERKVDPLDGKTTTTPLLADGSLQLLLVVNLETWAAFRIPIPAERFVITDGIGTDGTYVYVSLGSERLQNVRVDELRRYPLARIAEWGTPWVPE